MESAKAGGGRSYEIVMHGNKPVVLEAVEKGRAEMLSSHMVVG